MHRVQHFPWKNKEHPQKEEILGQFRKENLNDWREWSNGPGFIYGLHSHDYTKVLYCLSGSIVFNIPSQDLSFDLRPGDRLIIPPKTAHSAQVGDQGVTCLEAPKYN